MKKNNLLLLCFLFSGNLFAQFEHIIHRNAQIERKSIFDIDSIRFSPGNEMQVQLRDGSLSTFPISQLDSVTLKCAPGIAHTCGTGSIHNPALNYGIMSDQQGNTYKTIVIGTQEWMAENLRTSVFRNGATIPHIIDTVQWVNCFNNQYSAWCYPQNISDLECPYGKMYNWYAVTDQRNLCPAGWHIPSIEEWATLLNFLDSTSAGGDNGLNSVGSKLKTTCTTHWQFPNSQGRNSSGFSALPGGMRTSLGEFAGYYPAIGFYWSRSESFPGTGSNAGLCISAAYNNGNATKQSHSMAKGMSVRCMKD